MGAQQCLAAEHTREYEELAALAKLREELDFDERKRKVIVLGPAGSGKSTLIAAVKRRFKHAPVTVKCMQLHRQAWFTTVQYTLQSLLNELSSDLTQFAKPVWTPAKVKEWTEYFANGDYSMDADVPDEFCNLHLKRRAPADPASAGTRLTNAALAALRPSDAARLRHQHEQEDVAYRRDYNKYRTETATDRAALRPLYWTKLCREMDEKCTELLAEPVARRWLSRAGERSPNQMVAATNYCGVHIPHINGFHLIALRAVYLDQEKWTRVDGLPFEMRVVAGDGSFLSRAATACDTKDVAAGSSHKSAAPVFAPFSKEEAVALSDARVLWSAFHPDAHLLIRERTSGISVDSINFHSWYKPNDWVQLQFVDIGGSRPDRSKWKRHFDDVTHIVYCVALDHYDTTLWEDPSVSSIIESCDLWRAVSGNKVFQKTKVILAFTRLDVFESKYREFGLPEPNNLFRGGADFFAPLLSVWKINERGTGGGGSGGGGGDAKSASKPDVDTVIRYIVDTFRKNMTFVAPNTSPELAFELPVVVLNSLDGKSTEVITRLVLLNEESKWRTPSAQQYTAEKTAALKPAKQPPAAAPTPLTALIDVKSDLKSSENSATPPATWNDVRARVLQAAAASDQKTQPIRSLKKCPFLYPSDSKPPHRGTLHGEADSLSTDLVPALNHPAIPPIFKIVAPPAPEIPDTRAIAEWQSASEFERFLTANVNPPPTAEHKIAGVNLWILRSPRVWSPDRTVHAQFPTPFRRAVRTLLLIWSRRQRRQPETVTVTATATTASSDPQAAAAVPFAAHPLSRLPRDVLFRIVTYFADVTWLTA